MGKKKVSNIEDSILVDVILEAIKDKKGQNIIKLDLREVTNTVCDYFIICEGESNTQVNALADNIEKESSLKLQYPPHHIEGKLNAHWVLLDYFSVIVHVFQKEHRDFYKLEELWSDGKRELIA